MTYQIGRSDNGGKPSFFTKCFVVANIRTAV